MNFENLACGRRGDVLAVSLNRPQKLNSLSVGLLRDMSACADAIQRDRSIRAVLLTGAGRGFCAGADLTDAESSPAPGQTTGQWIADRMRAHFNPVAVKWSSLPVPLVVAVNGVAAGAGVSIALLGDITIACRSASFSILFTSKLALAPDTGATHLLPSRIGMARARHLAMTGRPVTAEEAQRIGLIAECVDDGVLAVRAMELADELAAGPTQAYLAVRALLTDGAAGGFAAQLEREAVVQRQLGDTEDFAEGVAAFREKRAPRFQGR